MVAGGGVRGKARKLDRVHPDAKGMKHMNNSGQTLLTAGNLRVGCM